MDSHYSHVFNYCFKKMMYERNIKVLALNPHTSHWAQPLDRNPFSSIKEHFNRQMQIFLRKSGGRTLQKTEYMSLFNVAWVKAINPQNIKAGFKRIGVWPPNPDIIPAELFAVARKSESKSVLKCLMYYQLFLFYSVLLLFSIATFFKF